MKLLVFFWIRIIFQWNNGCCFFFRCGYSTINHAMRNPLSPITTVFVISLLNYSIMKILLTVFLHHRLWSIILGIVLSTHLPIMIWSFFTGTICIWNCYIWPMGDTWQLIGGLLPIILIESYSKHDFLPCLSIFLEGFN